MPTTVFSAALNANDSGNNGYSFRNVCLTTAGSLGQVRVTYQAGTAASWIVANASVGKGNGSPPAAGGANTAATPVELLFSGLSGFTCPANSTITSDWATLAWNSADNLIAVVDITSGSNRFISAGGGLYYHAAAASYNVANESAWGGQSAAFTSGVSLIETQAAAGGGGLKLNSSMDGLGASGGFFSNPLARSVLGWRPSIVTARRKLIVPRHAELRLAA